MYFLHICITSDSFVNFFHKFCSQLPFTIMRAGPMKWPQRRVATYVVTLPACNHSRLIQSTLWNT